MFWINEFIFTNIAYVLVQFLAISIGKFEISDKIQRGARLVAREIIWLSSQPIAERTCYSVHVILVWSATRLRDVIVVCTATCDVTA